MQGMLCLYSLWPKREMKAAKNKNTIFYVKTQGMTNEYKGSRIFTERKYFTAFTKRVLCFLNE